MNSAPQLYLKYPMQSNPQDAYLLWDTRTGDVAAVIDYEIGGAVPMLVYRGAQKRYRVSQYLSAGEIADMLTRARSVVEVYAGMLEVIDQKLDALSGEFDSGSCIVIGAGEYFEHFSWDEYAGWSAEAVIEDLERSVPAGTFVAGLADFVLEAFEKNPN